MKDYKKIIEGVVNIISTTKKSDIGFANICTYIGEKCPELAESEDERIRKAIKYCIKQGFIGHGCIENVIVDDCLAWLEKQGGNKSVEWCKNDDVMLKQLIRFFEDKDTILQHDANLYAGWLKSIKDRVIPQPKQEWSEEDVRNCQMLQKIICDSDITANLANKLSDWLESLKERYTWKPSDEQMLAVNTAIKVLGKGTINGKQLIVLQEQLKRLKRE